MAETSKPPIDVFISHATDDDATITRIHDALTAAGINTWVDHLDGINPGDHWGREIHTAANDCINGLFVLSPKSAKSAYCEAEWTRVLALGKLLYIALIEPVPTRDFPLRLGTIQYADLTRDFGGGMAELIRAITGRRTLDPAAATTGQARHVSGNFPRWHLDLPLIGRDADLGDVRADLADGSRAAVILGLGGVGKTRLAAEIVNTSDFKDGVVWHTIDPHTTADDLTLAIRDHLGLGVTSEADATWAALGKRRTLLVLDNAEDCAQPAAYAARLNALDRAGGTRVLLTSRNQWRELRNAKMHDLHAPDAESAVAILRAMAANEPPAYAPDGFESQLAEAAHRHPRLIHYAVRWLDAYPPDYVLEMLRTLKGADAEEALDDMIRKTVRAVESREGGAEAIAALRRLAVCRGGFTFEAARAIIGAATDPRSLALLKSWGLVTFGNGRYDVDPLVTAAVGEDAAAIDAHYAYYEELARQHDQKQDYLGLDHESANLEAAFERMLAAGRPEDAFWLANACSDFLANRGRFELRIDWLERVATNLKGTSNDRLRATIQNNLGLAYNERLTGNHRENQRRAIATYWTALQTRTEEGAPQEYAETQNNLGVAYGNLALLENGTMNI